MVGIEEEEREKRSLLGAAETDRLAVDERLQWAQDAELHTRRRPYHDGVLEPL